MIPSHIQDSGMLGAGLHHSAHQHLARIHEEHQRLTVDDEEDRTMVFPEWFHGFDAPSKQD
jgi:hypothetical protein